jgi:hypothetical protein
MKNLLTTREQWGTIQFRSPTARRPSQRRSSTTTCIAEFDRGQSLSPKSAAVYERNALQKSGPAFSPVRCKLLSKESALFTSPIAFSFSRAGKSAAKDTSDTEGTTSRTTTQAKPDHVVAQSAKDQDEDSEVILLSL